MPLTRLAVGATVGVPVATLLLELGAGAVLGALLAVAIGGMVAGVVARRWIIGLVIGGYFASAGPPAAGLDGAVAVGALMVVAVTGSAPGAWLAPRLGPRWRSIDRHLGNV